MGSLWLIEVNALLLARSATAGHRSAAVGRITCYHHRKPRVRRGAPVVAATVTLQGRTVVTSVTVYYGFDSNMTAGLFQVKVTHPNYVDYERTAEANRAVHKYISYIAARVVVTRQHRSDSVGEEDGPRQNTADGARVRLPRHGWAGRC
ncbi:hypothetical protein LuPra_02531 [Luteitalea pratensis]|uniref:Uncharacterized protein n=1 Tax=Luteitalea pratensis TaxID=1855912 RepID=A0A143PLL8_LUTPR|nr:hypothetical protein LuPra_02531 [Luteitalea pratensis]